MCFVNSAPAHTNFSNFQGEKQDIPLLWLYKTSLQEVQHHPEVYRNYMGTWETCEHVIHSLVLSFLRHTDVGATRSAASALRFAVNMNGKHVIMKVGACDTKSVNVHI